MQESRNSRHSWGGRCRNSTKLGTSSKNLLHLLLNLLSLLHVHLLLHQALVFILLGLQVVARHRLLIWVAVHSFSWDDFRHSNSSGETLTPISREFLISGTDFRIFDYFSSSTLMLHSMVQLTVLADILLAGWLRDGLGNFTQGWVS